MSSRFLLVKMVAAKYVSAEKVLNRLMGRLTEEPPLGPMSESAPPRIS